MQVLEVVRIGIIKDVKKMIIGLKAGHTIKGVGTGATGIVKETDKNREVVEKLTNMLNKKGHTVIDCTIDSSNNDTKESVLIANKYKLDIFIDVHLNASNITDANGVEVFTYSAGGTAFNYAKKVQSELVHRIGWRDRGVKQANFYTLRYTTAPALYLELGFVTNRNDMNRWNTQVICNSVFKAITGVEYTDQVIEPKPPTEATTNVYRVSLNGTQIGAYSNIDNICKEVKTALQDNITNITIIKK